MARAPLPSRASALRARALRLAAWKDQSRTGRVRAWEQSTERVARRWSENSYADFRAAGRFHSTSAASHQSANDRAVARRRERYRKSWSAPAHEGTRDAAAQKRAGVLLRARRERQVEFARLSGC